MLWRTDLPRWHPPGFIQPCLPTPAQRPPCGPQWAYEIKHDGYRLMARKTAQRVRIFTRRGADWSHRFPRIVEAVSRLPASSIMLDGEGVICGQDGVSDFNALHSKNRDDDVMLYAFDLLELNGEDVRQERLDARKAKLAGLLRRSHANGGILLNEHVADDGALVFAHACLMGLEGIVAQRIDLPYRSGRSKAWRKVRNPKAPAATRIEDRTF
jgi:bifunctional non-homologous end joining protein LigD